MAAVCLFGVTLATYWPVLRAGFIWDDDGHVTRPALRGAAGLAKIWLQPGATQQYYPLLHTAFWLEHRVWGDSAGAYHGLNVCFHATAAWLLFAVLRRLSVPAALFGACAFALHPVMTETVAWVSEQKNTLSAIWALAAALAYLRFDRGRGTASYTAALLFFACALATKSVTATLPAALLVVFWWQRGQLALRRDVLPLAPFFGLSVAAAVVTAWVERTYIGAHGAAFAIGPVSRVLIAGRAFWFYAGKLIWPAKLTFIYPHWSIGPGAAAGYVYPVAAVAVLFCLFTLRHRARGPLAVALLFAGLLSPALGFVNVYPFIYSYVADHFQYLAAMTVIPAAAAALSDAMLGLPRRVRWVGQTVGMLVLVGYGVLTRAQCGEYLTSERLWRTTLARNPACWMAYQNLGGVYLAQGRPEEAAAEFQHALAINPRDTEAMNELAVALMSRGDAAGAIALYQQALSLRPDDAETEINLGMALLQQHDTAKAAEHFERAAELSPVSAIAQKDLALARAQQGDNAGAVAALERAAALEPDVTDTRRRLVAARQRWAEALVEAGKLDGAVPVLKAAATEAPDAPDIHNQLGALYETLGNPDGAKAEYRAAIAVDAGYPTARINLGNLLLRTHDAPAAITEYNAALALTPNDAHLRNHLGIALAMAGRREEAANQFRQAATEDPAYADPQRNLKRLLESPRH